MGDGEAEEGKDIVSESTGINCMDPLVLEDVQGIPLPISQSVRVTIVTAAG